MAEHFLLSSYHLPQTAAHPGPAPPSASQVEYLHAKNQHKRLCVATPAVGITVYDLADQTPLSSLTLGPSFRPSSAPVARSTPFASAESIRVKNVRNTWVGVATAEQSGEVWSWTEEERKDGSVEGEATKIVYPVPAPLTAIFAPRGLPNLLVLLSSTGALSLASESDLTTVSSLPAPASRPLSQSMHVRPISTSSTLLPPSLLALIPAPTRAHVAIVVRTLAASSSEAASLAEASKKKFKKSKRPSAVAVIDEAESQTPAGPASEVELVLLDSEVMRDGEISSALVVLGSIKVDGSQVAVSDDGCVSALASDGALASYRLTLSGTVMASTYAELFSPTSFVETRLLLSPMHTLPLSRATIIPSSVTLLALHSSFVLLASVKPPTSTTEETPGRVAALVWDVRLGAVVSDSEIPIPATAFPPTVPARTLVLSLHPLARDAVALAVCPSSGTTGRSLLFVLPLALPSASVLAAVVGKQALTRKYIKETADVVEKAKRAEPLRHPKTSKGKMALLEASEKARATLLGQLANTLKPLVSGHGDVDSAIAAADELFNEFVKDERVRLEAYAAKKTEASVEKEKKRRAAALEAKDQVLTTTKKYRHMRIRIEEAIAEAAPTLTWSEVTAKRIKNVNDVYRYKYYEVRKALEKAKSLGLPVADVPVVHQKHETQEPTLPSSFVAAVLCLCFPNTFEAESALVSPGTSTLTWKHPTKIVAYLLERDLIGDGLLPGGVTRLLARAGDWPNILRALQSVPDVPESVTVSLLKRVVAHHMNADASALEVDVDSLPYPPPTLRLFLTSFVESPSTPALLRQALQQQLTAVEALPVLRCLDDWLLWWAARGGGGGHIVSGDGADWKARGKDKPKRLPTNPFVTASLDTEDEAAPPRVEDILPVVQALLDAHFVSLLLQRQSHALLRRLSGHVRTHVALQADLSGLLGALSIYARAKDEQKKAVAVDKSEQDHQALGASMAARVAAQEKHAEVLDYSLDKFWL